MRIKWYHIVIFVGAVVGLAVLLLPGEREWGLQLDEGGYMQRSEEHLVRALEKDPRDEELLRRLSSIYLRTKRPAKAVPLLERLMRVVKDPAAVRDRLIDLHVQVGNLERAIALLKQSATTANERRRLVTLYEQAGEIGEAVKVVKTLLEANPEDTELLKQWARLERWRTNPPGEVEALRALAKVRPEKDALHRLMYLELSQGDLQAAVEAADRLAELPDPGVEELRSMRNIYMRARRLQPALKAAERTCELPQSGPADIRVYAQLQQSAGKQAAALQTLQKGIEAFPKSLDLLRRAESLARKLEKDELTAKLTLKIAEQTDQEPDRVDAARAQARIGQVDRARKLLRELMETEEQLSAHTLWYAGSLHLQTDRRERALRVAERLAKQARARPENPQPARLAADLFYRLSRPERQTEMMELAARAAPEDPRVLQDLAVAYTDAARYEDALDVLNRLKELPRADMKLVRRDRARVLVEMVRGAPEESDRKKELRQQAMRAIESSLNDAEYPDLRGALVGFYAAAGNYEKARTMMSRLKGVSSELWLDLAGRFADAGKADLVREALPQIGDTSDFDAQQLDLLGYAHRAAGNLDRAIDCYERAVAKAPDNQDLRLKLADVYGAAEQFEKEYEIVEEIAQGGTVEEWIDAANRHLWHGDRKGEALVLARALEEHPNAPGLLQRRLQALVAMGRYEEAVKVYDRMQTAGAQVSADTLVALADAQAGLGNDSRAADLYRKALNEKPEQPQALFGLADVRFRAGHYDRAAGLYRRYLKVAPEDGVAWFELGETLYEAGKDGSEPQQRALDLLADEDDAQTLAIRARIHTRQGEPQQAADLYARALDKKPNDPELASDYVSLLLQMDKPERADRVLTRMAGTHPEHGRLRRLRASWLLQKDQPSRALSILEELEKENPRDVELLRDIANTYMQVGRFADARNTLDKLAALGADREWIRRQYAQAALDELWQLDPDDPRRERVARRAVSAIEAALQDESDAGLSRSLAEVYLELERSADALERARDLKQMSPWFCVELASSFVKKGSPNRARQALSLLPPAEELEPATLVSVGSVWQQLDEQEKAVKVYRVAVDKNPNYDDAVVSLADACGQIGKTEKQYALMERRARSGGPQEWLDAADRHVWHDDYEGEVALLNEALQAYPQSPDLVARGVRSFGRIAKYEKALELYKRLQEMGRGQDAVTLAVVGDALVNSGRLDEAQLTYKRALEKDPLNRRAVLGLAGLQTGKGQYRKAAELYRSYLREKPEAGWVWFELGEVIYQGGGDGSAAHQRAERLVPLNDEPARLAMHGRIYARRKEWKRAIDLYEKALSTATSDPNLACDFVDVLMSAGRTEHAERVLAAVANRHPRNFRVRHQQAALMMRRSHYRKAADVLRELHRRRPEEVTIERDLALAERLSGRWAVGMQHYDSTARRSDLRQRPIPASGLQPALKANL